MKVIKFLLFIAILLISCNLYADNSEEEKKYIVLVKLPLIPKISIMQISTKLSINNNEKYELYFNIKTLNLIDYISNVNGDGYVSGDIIDSMYVPNIYKYDYIRKSKKKSVSLKYLDGMIIEEIFIPKFNKDELTPINSEQKINTIDPATLFLRLIDLKSTNQCTDNINVYDGKRRYDIIFKKEKLGNQIIECLAWQNRIGGYKEDKVDPLTNTDTVKIRYEIILDNKFLELYAKKGLIEITIEEIN